MASHAQHKHLNGVLLPMIWDKMCILKGKEYAPSKELILGLKELLKRYLGVASTAMLSEMEFSFFTKKVLMIAAREWGLYLPEKFHEPYNAEDMDLGDYLDMIGYY